MIFSAIRCVGLLTLLLYGTSATASYNERCLVYGKVDAPPTTSAAESDFKLAVRDTIALRFSHGDCVGRWRSRLAQVTLNRKAAADIAEGDFLLLIFEYHDSACPPDKNCVQQQWRRISLRAVDETK